MNIKSVLQERFIKNMKRHPNTSWDKVEQHLDESILYVLNSMEKSGGEPDLVEYNNNLLYVDMVSESPIQRRSLCYDKEARLSRKKFPPVSSVMEEVEKMKTILIDEDLYLFLQTIEQLDLKTSSWLSTPTEIREMKGAIFGDRRFGRTFVFHNTAESYYKDRGFRTYIILV